MSITDEGYQLPSELRHAEFTLRPITADDAAADHDALMETRELLRLWEQSSWPEDDFTVEANRADLTKLEKRHAERYAYTFTVLAPGGSECWGCVYVFPITAAFLTKATVTTLEDQRWNDVDAVVYFWARLTQMQTGFDERLLAELRVWFRNEWNLDRTVYVTNEQFTQQRQLIEGTDLRLEFELVEPEKPGTYLVYGEQV